MRKFLDFLGIAFEIFKSFLLRVIIIFAIVLFIIVILHNILKIVEIYQEGETDYKQLVWVDQNRMNVQVKGTGEKTIVILSDFGCPSPVIQYKTYVDRLANSYKVVVIEYFGYGFSLSTKEERTSEKIAYEIKTALEQLEIYDNYILLANGASSIYAYAYTNLYPENVEKLFIVDGLYPAMIENKDYKEYLEEYEKNVIGTSYAELTGFARILSYVKPSAFYIDKMKEYGFSKEDISVYRKMIANKFYTENMKNEIIKMNENMENLVDYKFPEYLPVTQIFSSEYIKENEKYDIQKQANNLITNVDLQDIFVIESNKNLNMYNPDKVINKIIGE